MTGFLLVIEVITVLYAWHCLAYNATSNRHFALDKSGLTEIIMAHTIIIKMHLIAVVYTDRT